MKPEVITIEPSSTKPKELVSIIKKHTPNEYYQLIDEAVAFTKSKHRGQKRLSGETFYHHPLNVAAIVAQLDLDTNAIIAALLHNVPNRDNPLSDIEALLEIQETFGKEVSEMVLTINTFSRATRSVSEQEMITRFILRSTDDLRPIIIKLADRLHNARTIDFLPPKKQKILARNLIDIYAPLADYLNQYLIKKELEEIAFRILNPNEHQEISDKIKPFTVDIEAVKDEILLYLTNLSSKVNTDNPPVIYGRIKGNYGLHKKFMKRGYKDISEVYDYLAYTVLYDTPQQCYAFLKELMRNVDFDLTFYDDYIKKPKQNGFRGLHLPIMIPRLFSNYFEVQIKTHEMHHNNTYGPASHLSYKYSKESEKADLKYYWVKELHSNLHQYYSEHHKGISTPIPTIAYNNKIYVFSPDDTIVELPIGSTAIDFAYKVHSKLGNKAVGATINGLKAELSTMLKNGDQVHIEIDENKEYPDREWLQFVRTRKARDAIETEYRKYLLEKDLEFTHVI